MGLTTIFGINGVGKDTVAEKLRANNPDITVTSMSRMLMYLLGISKTYDTREKISEKQYKKLENTPQKIISSIENNEYRKLLEELSATDNVIFLAHLVSALRLGNETMYLTDKQIPKWFVDINEQMIQLVAPASIISQRRKEDKSRRRNCNIEQIFEHQELCSKEWQRIRRRNPNKINQMHIVENIELDDAVRQIENIIYERSTNYTENEFLKGLKCDVPNVVGISHSKPNESGEKNDRLEER